MKKLTAALVGAGNRGCIYADYSLAEKDELEIIAVVDTNPVHRKEAKERYKLSDENCFVSLDDFLARQISCDFIINATMDEAHYETAKKIMEAGYDMLLEKPIVNNEKELLELQKIANQKGVRVVICHVLRYTPFYKKIKEIIQSGKIGKIMTMEMNEHVGIAHFIDSFVRGKWKSEARCGSSFLLQKSCHDMDLLCWLNNGTQPKKVFSFGSRSLFIKENRPKDSTKYCYNCPHNEVCLYSAQKIHLEIDSMPFQTWLDMGKPIDAITKEEKREWLKTSEYGLCAYESGGDITDRQTVNVEFENGSTAVFTMVGATSMPGRYIHICGTAGEIEGRMESGKFVLRIFNRSGERFWYDEEEIDVSKAVQANEEKGGGHSGGDYSIMREFTRYLNGDTSSLSITNINDSINGHLLVYKAEDSRKNKIVCHI